MVAWMLDIGEWGQQVPRQIKADAPRNGARARKGTPRVVLRGHLFFLQYVMLQREGYFRHGAKSEPANRDDLRVMIEKNLEGFRRSWI